MWNWNSPVWVRGVVITGNRTPPNFRWSRLPKVRGVVVAGLDGGGKPLWRLRHPSWCCMGSLARWGLRQSPARHGVVWPGRGLRHPSGCCRTVAARRRLRQPFRRNQGALDGRRLRHPSLRIWVRPGRGLLHLSLRNRWGLRHLSLLPGRVVLGRGLSESGCQGDSPVSWRLRHPPGGDGRGTLLRGLRHRSGGSGVRPDGGPRDPFGGDRVGPDRGLRQPSGRSGSALDWGLRQAPC